LLRRLGLVSGGSWGAPGEGGADGGSAAGPRRAEGDVVYGCGDAKGDAHIEDAPAGEPGYCWGALDAEGDGDGDGEGERERDDERDRVGEADGEWEFACILGCK
jgi:hypothetical protein